MKLSVVVQLQLVHRYITIPRGDLKGQLQVVKADGPLINVTADEAFRYITLKSLRRDDNGKGSRARKRNKCE